MELIRRSVWARWTTATSLTSSPGPQNGCSSCFQREGLNSWANLYSSDGSENGAPALKWRGERGGVGGLLGTHLPVGETNANHLLSNHRLAIQHLAERDPVSDAVSAVPDSEDDSQTLFYSRHRQTSSFASSENLWRQNLWPRLGNGPWNFSLLSCPTWRFLPQCCYNHFSVD